MLILSDRIGKRQLTGTQRFCKCVYLTFFNAVHKIVRVHAFVQCILMTQVTGDKRPQKKFDCNLKESNFCCYAHIY